MNLDYLTWAEINLNAVKHNLKEIRKLAARNKFIMPFREKGVAVNFPSVEILAVVKSDAYGHGMEKVAVLLAQQGVNCFGVSNIFEGIRLRNAGIKKQILIFENTLRFFVKQVGEYDLIPTVGDLKFAAALDMYARKKRKQIDIHVKVDTGMGRLGIWHEEAFDFIKNLFQFNNLRITGIYTHFPSADIDRRFTENQIKQLYNLVARLDNKGLIIPYIHASNSMGLAGYKTHVLNLARPGLMLYGLYPDLKLKKEINLKPVLNVKSKVVFLKKIKKGRSVSYGRTFIAKKDLTVAVIPIGYNDGYLRAFSNKSFILINGSRCPVLGKVTMNQIIVDVSKVNTPKLGMPVIILGQHGDKKVSADDLAKNAGTINYEVVCSLGNRLPRVYK